MGKVFYGTHSDKITAMRLANAGARSYKKGVCWTPSKESKCVLNSETNLWTCRASAHHHEGSCGTWEIHHRGSGLPWQLGYTCDETGCRPYVGGDPHGSLVSENESSTDQFNKDSEGYTDALPEDYDYNTI